MKPGNKNKVRDMLIDLAKDERDKKKIKEMFDRHTADEIALVDIN